MKIVLKMDGGKLNIIQYFIAHNRMPEDNPYAYISISKSKHTVEF